MNYISPTAVGDNAEFVTPIGLAFTVLMSLLLLTLPRRKALAPVIVLICFMTMGERIVLGGLNFTMIRILLFFGWMRLISRGELRGMKWCWADTFVVAWAVIRTLNYTLVWGTTDAFINRMGHAYNALAAYFLFRFLVRDEEDVFTTIRQLALAVGPLALIMMNEKITGRNLFAALGGVPVISELRSGVVRCQGPFAHSILAGTFGATTVPLFVGMWLRRKSTAGLALLAIASSTLIVYMGGSSGPILAYAFSMLALSLWFMRKNLSVIRWSIALLLLTLHFVMNSPVWFVIARASVFSGSTGWYRGFLIDMSVRHFNEWWLIGTTAATKWHYYLADVTNQYLLEGLSGGMVTMLLFIGILSTSFRSVGLVVRSSTSDPKVKLLAWALGGALLGHAVSFISVSYFDQNIIIFYWLLAAIAALGKLPVAARQDAGNRNAVRRPVAPPIMWPPSPETKYSR
ncbi:MAG: hypothetical protein QM757_28490 [Paludibaculum sp.]